MITLDSLDLQTFTPEKLGELLIEAKNAYYTTGKPIMDDHTYDTLEEILRQKNPYHRIFLKAGHPNFDTGWTKKKHFMAMGSQNKVTTYSELVHYFQLKKNAAGSNVDMHSISYVVQPKCDGISLEIIYQQGKLVESITRGDGEVGDVITQNVIKMKNVALNLSEKFTGSVRCEIVVTKKDFEKLNQNASEKYSNPRNAASGLPAKAQTFSHNTYSNPRNAAAGLSQRLDSLFCGFCTLFAVDLHPFTHTEVEKIKHLKSLGFTPVESHLCHNFEDVENVYQQFLSSKRISYPFDIDGLVVKINQPEVASGLGSKNNRPKYQVAYKFPATSQETQVKSVDWQVGPMGSITPVAKVDPIEISGAVVTYASLANYDLVVKKNINQGDIVKISRQGDVIPFIEKVVTKVNPGHIPIPTHCPSCHTPLTKTDKFLKCPNFSKCLPQIIGSLNLFCQTLDIQGLSTKTISKLYEARRLTLPGDFYKLTINDIKDLDNLGEKSAKNIIHQIQSKKVLSVVEAFDAAIIPHFSRKRINMLINAGFDTPQKLLKLTVSQISSLPGFKLTLAQKIVDGIHQRRPWIDSILSNTKIQDLKSNIKNLPFTGLNFCITGSLSQPRKDIEKLIEANGGQLMSAVTSKTDYLVTNDTVSDSSKFKTAKKLGVKIISEKELLAKLN